MWMDASMLEHAIHLQMCDVKNKRPLTWGLMHDRDSGADQLRICLAEGTGMLRRCDRGSALGGAREDVVRGLRRLATKGNLR